MLKVNERVLNKTKKCKNNYICLIECRDIYHKICPINLADEPDILFIEPKDFKQCPYRLTFGYSNMCRCPVRYELFKKYHL